MIRRIAFAAVFAAVALSATGCCGTFRNLVYRIRHCNGCYPAYGGGGCCDGAVASPSYSMPIMDAAPVIGGGAPGCATCASNPGVPYGSAGVPYGTGGVPYASAGVPVVPSYSMPPGAAMAGGPVAVVK